MEVIESRLESQERFWRAKLRTVESEYQKHIEHLREEFQRSLQVNPHQQQHQVETIERSSRVKWRSNGEIISIKPSTPATSVSIVPTDTEESLMSPLQRPERKSEHDPEVVTIRPVPKPRSVRVPKETPPEADIVTGLPPKVPKQVRHPDSTEKVIPATMTTQAPSEDTTAVTSDDTTTGEESDTLGTFSSPLHLQKSPPIYPWQNSTGKAQQSVEQAKVVDLNSNVTGERGPKAEALQELGQQLKELGLSPDATQLPKKNMKKSLRQMKSRRKSLAEVKLLVFKIC